ncbi:hypothetical protein BDR07DRAFT_1431047 [Suillus spraguei]|nr:hypothetical protein BDR07DRAFT_1431047 [Suillus spraguei]
MPTIRERVKATLGTLDTAATRSANCIFNYTSQFFYILYMAIWNPAGFILNALYTVVLWVKLIAIAVAISTLPGPTHVRNERIQITLIAAAWAVLICFDIMKVNASYRPLLGRHVELDGFWRRSGRFRTEYPLMTTKLEHSRLYLLLIRDRNIFQHVRTLFKYHQVSVHMKIIFDHLPLPALLNVHYDDNLVDAEPDTWTEVLQPLAIWIE